jgi:hypothetical protein
MRQLFLRILIQCFQNCRFQFRQRGFRICIKDIFQAHHSKAFTFGIGCVNDAVGINKESISGMHRNRQLIIKCIQIDGKGYVQGETITLTFAFGRSGIGPGFVNCSSIKYRGMTGIRDFCFAFLTVVRDNCRGRHCIQAAAADSLVNFAQNDPTVRLSHMGF